MNAMRVNVAVGERLALIMPYSEVCMAMRVAERPMLAEVTPDGRAVQLYTMDGERFSAPITPGEAGIYTDADGMFVVSDQVVSPV